MKFPRELDTSKIPRSQVKRYRVATARIRLFSLTHTTDACFWADCPLLPILKCRCEVHLAHWHYDYVCRRAGEDCYSIRPHQPALPCRPIGEYLQDTRVLISDPYLRVLPEQYECRTLADYNGNFPKLYFCQVDSTISWSSGLVTV